MHSDIISIPTEYQIGIKPQMEEKLSAAVKDVKHLAALAESGVSHLGYA